MNWRTFLKENFYSFVEFGVQIDTFLQKSPKKEKLFRGFP